MVPFDMGLPRYKFWMSGLQKQIGDFESPSKKEFSVIDLSLLIGDLFERSDLQGITVIGEVTNFKRHGSGHLYFSLSEQRDDKAAMVNCVMWRREAGSAQFLESGMKVRAEGSISHYAPQGKYQFYVNRLRKEEDRGAKFVLVEQWKRELEAEGIFALERKRPVPKFPTRVGVVTSETGAVLQDIRNIIARRFPLEIWLSPTLVQGEEAHLRIAEAIRRIDGQVDVIIVCRGGGSFEDLFPFNHPDVARAVAACRVPVVSAIGHEVDTTLCDFAADLRAPTPSAAAEMVVPDRAALSLELQVAGDFMRTALVRRLGVSLEEVGDLRERIRPHRLLRRLTERREYVDEIGERLCRALQVRIGRGRAELSELCGLLTGVSPARALSLGYAFVRRDGKIVGSVGEIDAGDRLEVTLSDGTFYVVVQEVKHGSTV